LCTGSARPIDAKALREASEVSEVSDFASTLLQKLRAAAGLFLFWGCDFGAVILEL